MKLHSMFTSAMCHRAAAWSFGLLALACSPSQAQDTLVRATVFEYHSTTGLLTSETVDPGGSHCVKTTYEHDAYGNREKITVSPCATNATGPASFAPRVTVNEFAAGANHPAGAYATRTQTGTATGTQALQVMAESKATFDARSGGALTATEVALGQPDGSADITTRAGYDALGRATVQYTPAKRANGTVDENRVESVIVYCPLDSTISSAPACIHITTESVQVTYASKRLVVTATGAQTSSATIRLRTAYYIESTPKDKSGVAIGAKSRVHYDALHREFAKETQGYDGKWVRTMTGFDALGMTAVTWGPHVVGDVANGQQPAPPIEMRQWTVARDIIHRPTEAQRYWRGAANAAAVVVSSRVEYNGLRSTTISPGTGAAGDVERRHTTVKNAVGQVVQTIDPYEATLNSAYDGFGNLVQTKDALGNLTTISYTPGTARFKTAMSDPDRGNWSYVYDALGQLKSQTDGNNKTTQISYDELGRVVQRKTPSFEANWRYGTYVPAAGATTGAFCASGLPRLCEAWTGAVNARSTSKRLSYDNLGRATEAAEQLDRGYTSKTAFDDLGRVSSVTYPSNLVLDYTYSSTSLPAGKTPGVLVKVTQRGNAAVPLWSIEEFAMPFDVHGNLVRQRTGDGVATEHQLDSITGKAFALRAGLGSGNHGVLNQGYTYDKVHNLLTRSNGFTAGTETFAYDRLDRLVSYAVDSPYNGADRTVTVQYNALGNILAKSDVGGYSYQSGRPHAASSVAGNTYHYDGNGNLLSTGGSQPRSHSWTDFNLPQSLSRSGSTVSFWYDEQLKRVQEVTQTGGNQKRVWMLHPNNAGGLGFEREETLVNGVVTRNENRHYISVGGAVIGVVKTLNANVAGDLVNHAVSAPSNDAELTQFWHKDSLGSIVAVTNRAGTVKERPAFDAWGRRLLDTGFADTSSTGPAHGDRGYTGHEHLDELGLVHMNGRVYDPFLGRFLSPDPVIQSPGDLQNYNLYSYVMNNPLKYTDPSGQCFMGVDTAVCIYVFLAGAALAYEGNQYWSMAGRLMMMAALQGNGGLVESGLGRVADTFAAQQLGNVVASAAIATAATRGSSSEDILSSALFAAAFYAAGVGVSDPGLKVLAHALIGCAQGAVSGGECGPSAAAAGFGKAVSIGLESINPVVGGVITTIVGGTIAEMGGGKFANGALSAGMGYLFNKLASASPGGQGKARSSGSGLRVSEETYRTWGSYLPGTEAGDSAAQHWADLHVKTGNPLYAVPGVFASLWTPDTAVATTTTLLSGGAGSVGVRFGREVTFGSNVRVAPFGNRTGHSLGELPHYHRRGLDSVTGNTTPGQGIGRHRPWETKSTDKSFWDRF
jgi:RHS repeat-associated protein